MHVRTLHLKSRYILTAVLMLFCHLATADKALIIGYADYRPYSYLDQGKAQGLEVDLLNAVLADRLGVELEHRVLPWKRVQHQVASGQIDAFVAVASQARSSYAKPSAQALVYGQISAFTRTEDARFKGISTLSLAQLKPFDIGAIAGSGWVANNLPGYSVQSAFSIDAMADMLMAQRVDVIVENPLIFNHHLSLENQQLKVRETTIEQTGFELVFYVSRKSQHLGILESFDRALAQMRSDGSHAKILKPYYR
ncbi:MAG: substrate-binding periplasmic protein [Pseudomonadales bacterium]